MRLIQEWDECPVASSCYARSIGRHEAHGDQDASRTESTAGELVG